MLPTYHYFTKGCHLEMAVKVFIMSKVLSPVVVVDARYDATLSFVANAKGRTEMLYGVVTPVHAPNRKFPSSAAFVDAINAELGLSLDVARTAVFRSGDRRTEKQQDQLFGGWHTVGGRKAFVSEHIVFAFADEDGAYKVLVVEQEFFARYMIRGKKPSYIETVDAKGRKHGDNRYNFYLNGFVMP